MPFTYNDSVIKNKRYISSGVSATCNTVLNKTGPITKEDLLELRSVIISMMASGMSPREINEKFNLGYADFGSFVKQALGVNLRSKRDAVKLSYTNRGYGLSGRDEYRSLCSFKFDPYSIPSVPGYADLLKEGMYSETNKTGFTRDHMISVEFGWRNNIDPKIISHPANCEFLSMSANAAKNQNCSITIETLIHRIENMEFSTVERNAISVSKSNETKKRISIAMQNKMKITNGKTNTSIDKHSPIPDGFWRGITRGLK